MPAPAPLVPPTVDVPRLHDAVLDWFAVHARDLPWRAPGTSPWGVLLSEVMSHQTQVERVAPIWQEWIERWPTPAAFAQAGTDEILRAWGSLGYPRRALRLKECAQTIVRDHGGRVPQDVDTLLALPGIGDYTARAVACFAYGKNVPVVDTNVRRVVARVERGEALGKTADAAERHPVAHGGECGAQPIDVLRFLLQQVKRDPLRGLRSDTGEAR